jgi:hypothetical protein
LVVSARKKLKEELKLVKLGGREWFCNFQKPPYLSIRSSSEESPTSRTVA